MLRNIMLAVGLLASTYGMAETSLSIDFRKPEYKCSHPCQITHDEGTQFNPACGRSWKIDTYDSQTNDFSFMEIEWTLEKDASYEYALEILACARKDPPLLSNVTIAVNDESVASGYHMYNGPDSLHFPDENGKPHHMRWEVFQITEQLKDGKNKIKISLDKDTLSGFSMSWLHVRPFPKSL
jgi:hypothetical protein